MLDQMRTSAAIPKAKITVAHVGRAVQKLGTMDMAQKELLAAQIAKEQQALFASFLIQSQLGVAFDKMEFLLDILFVCFLAMKETGLKWQRITDDDVQACMNRCVEGVKFGVGLEPAQRLELVSQFVVGHPEPALLSYVQLETDNWQKRVTPEESDPYIILAALNMANCIGYAHLMGTRKLPPDSQKGPQL
jgi:hypothetical protein